MPIFEYICSECSEEFEAIVIGSSEDVRCPECGSKEIKTLFSAFSISGEIKAGSATSSCNTCTPNPSKCGSCQQ